jgi:hypothetical protein
MSIDIDLRKDYSLLLKNELHSLGIEIDINIPIDEIPCIYFNHIKRKIYPKPRRILKSDSFICPPELLLGLGNLENKIISGENLTPHLSKLVYIDYKSRDYMLNDWGIFHLHLGINMTDGFVDRTDPVLFCIVREETVYFIAMKHHGEWTDKSLLSIVYSNWSDLLKPFILPGVLSTTSNPTNEDIGKCRKGNVMLILEIAPGVVIAPPGGGYMTDGTSREVVTKKNNTMRMLSYLEDKIKANERNIRKRIISENKTPAKKLKFKLQIKDDTIFVYEIYSKMFFS